MTIGIGPDYALMIIAKREEGDTRFRIYISGGAIPQLRLVHTCGDDRGDEAGDREPRDPTPPYMAAEKSFGVLRDD